MFRRCNYVVVAIPPSLQNFIIIEPSQCPLNTETLYAPGENVFFNIVYKEPFRGGESVKNIVTTWDASNDLNIIYNATDSNKSRFVLAGFLDKPNLLPRQEKGLFDTLSDCYETEASNYVEYKEYDESLVNHEVKAGCPMSAMRPCSIDKHVNCTGVPYGRCDNVLYVNVKKNSSDLFQSN